MVIVIIPALAGKRLVNLKNDPDYSGLLIGIIMIGIWWAQRAENREERNCYFGAAML